jgi:hypothetical protein
MTTERRITPSPFGKISIAHEPIPCSLCKKSRTDCLEIGVWLNSLEAVVLFVCPRCIRARKIHV